MNEYLNSDPVTAGHITLKTKGTFTINNTGNVLKGDWSSLETVEGAYAVPMGTPPATPLVSNNHAESSPVFTNTQGSWKRSDIIRGKIYQVGHPLLVPEQPTQSILVMYTYENVQYYSRLNVPQSVWQSGHTYIYTLVFNNGIGLTLHLTAQAASWDDVAPNSCSLGVETKLSLESFVYRRYDEDDDLSTWDDSYVAVAYGKDRYGFPMCSSLMSLETTSTGSGLRLISDNDKFKFVQNVSNDTPVATLDISAGTDVKTYFYIVPADSYDISTLSDDERKANIYLMDIDNGTYISFNPGVFPSNDTYTSCKIYMVSYDDYFSGWSSKHLYNEPS